MDNQPIQHVCGRIERLSPFKLPAFQAGFFYGNRDNVPGYRWFDRRTQSVRVVSHPEDLRGLEAMVAADGNTLMHTFFASALNDVFNLHTKRVVVGAYYRIPGFLWWALIVASCVAMVAVGFQVRHQREAAHPHRERRARADIRAGDGAGLRS